MTRMNQYTASNNIAALRLEICMTDERSIKTGDADFISEPVFLNNSHLQQLKLHEQNLVKSTLNTNIAASEIDAQAAETDETQGKDEVSLLDVLNSYDANKPLQIKPVL